MFNIMLHVHRSMNMAVRYEDTNSVCMVVSSHQIYDANNPRFEVPHEHVKSVNKVTPCTPISQVLELADDPFGLLVSRDKKVL